MAGEGSLTILLIRHGEKPTPGDGALGLSIDGRPDPRALTVRGWQRAGALAALFGAGLSPDYPAPAAIYAPDPERSATGHGVSRRPFLTVVPLAERLGLAVETRFAQGEESGLATEVLAKTGVVLIVWEHKRLTADLLPALLPEQGRGEAPARWPSDRYDVVLDLRRENATATFAVRQRLPRLLAGDGADPMVNP